MANAKRLPSGNWRAQVYIGKDISGKRIIKSVTAPTKRETEYLAAELLSRTDASRFVTHDKNMTIGDAVDQYIDSKDGLYHHPLYRVTEGTEGHDMLRSWQYPSIK